MGTPESPMRESNISLESLTPGGLGWLKLFDSLAVENSSQADLSAKISTLSLGDLAAALAYYESSSKEDQILVVKDALRNAGVAVDVENGA